MEQKLPNIWANFVREYVFKTFKKLPNLATLPSSTKCNSCSVAKRVCSDGGHHCSMDLSAPSILRSRVLIPRTQSMLFPFIDYCTVFVIILRK